MNGVNKAIIIGRVGKDPEVRQMPNGNAVCNLTVATSEKWKDKNTGNQQEKTEWHRVVMYGKLADITGQYVHKGDAIYIEGRIQTREWEKDGVKRYSTEIIASQMQMLGSPNRGQQPAQQPPQAPTGGGPAFDDDIPFARVPGVC